MKNIAKLRNKIIYQIFPRSFMDSNNDGNGDLKGIESKLDYLKDLGVDIIWLCPIYDTKFSDAGYDVLDYFKIWKKFGTLKDFKDLVKKAKKYNIEIMMDIVLNHTSKDNKWFKKALKSEKNLEHSFYIWSDKKGAEESIFGGSSWEYVKKFDKYYYHLFTKDQVDLNWNNDATIQNFAKIIDFWYDLGIKYFRLDAIQHVAKDMGANFSHSFATNMVKILQKFNEVAFKNKKDVVCFGESSGITYDKILKYGQGKEKICDNFFNFSWWWIGWNKTTGRNGVDFNWKVSDFANSDAVNYQKDLNVKPEMLTNFLTNHDTSRAVSRWGNETTFWKFSAKSLAMLQFSLKGLISIYFGEEIGMLNNHFETLKDFKDIDVFNSFKILVEKTKTYSAQQMILAHNINSRDHSRYPMQWNNSVNYGFNKGRKTWIKLGLNLNNEINVESQQKDENSILNFYKKIIKLRKSKKYQSLLVLGFSDFYYENELLFVKRKYKNQKLITIINLNKKEIELKDKLIGYKVLIHSYDDDFDFKNLRPYEGVMLIKND